MCRGSDGDRRMPSAILTGGGGTAQRWTNSHGGSIFGNILKKGKNKLAFILIISVIGIYFKHINMKEVRIREEAMPFLIVIFCQTVDSNHHLETHLEAGCKNCY